MNETFPELDHPRPEPICTKHGDWNRECGCPPTADVEKWEAEAGKIITPWETFDVGRYKARALVQQHEQSLSQARAPLVEALKVVQDYFPHDTTIYEMIAARLKEAGEAFVEQNCERAGGRPDLQQSADVEKLHLVNMLGQPKYSIREVDGEEHLFRYEEDRGLPNNAELQFWHSSNQPNASAPMPRCTCVGGIHSSQCEAGLHLKQQPSAPTAEAAEVLTVLLDKGWDVEKCNRALRAMAEHYKPSVGKAPPPHQPTDEEWEAKIESEQPSATCSICGGVDNKHVPSCSSLAVTVEVSEQPSAPTDVEKWTLIKGVPNSDGDSWDIYEGSERIAFDCFKEDVEPLVERHNVLVQARAPLVEAAKQAIPRLERCMCAGSDGHRLNLKISKTLAALTDTGEKPTAKRHGRKRLPSNLGKKK